MSNITINYKVIRENAKELEKEGLIKSGIEDGEIWYQLTKKGIKFTEREIELNKKGKTQFANGKILTKGSVDID